MGLYRFQILQLEDNIKREYIRELEQKKVTLKSPKSTKYEGFNDNNAQERLLNESIVEDGKQQYIEQLSGDIETINNYISITTA